jgi:hypothetical protein
VSHLDPDLLALLALNEPVGAPADRAHLTECRICAQELAEMRHAAAVGRATLSDTELETPPDRVWARIADELDLTASSSPVPVPSPANDPAVPVQTRRRMRGRWILAACLVLFAAVGVGVWGTIAALRPTEIAAATLIAFPDHAGATGTADVEQARDGTLRLNVTLDGPSEEGAYREVWLIRSDATALISLGVLESTSGMFTIPAGIDLADYTLVDISVEPLDGDPVHSGDSIVRGELHRL